MTSRLLGGVMVVVGLSLTARIEAQDGYRLLSDRVQVSRASHWRAWSFPRDMVEITPTGRVRSRHLAPQTNAVLDAADFTYALPGGQAQLYENSFRDGRQDKARGGIKLAGTRIQRAARIMDGDDLTYWEPDAADGLDRWWVEIDLGRIVTATRIVVRFVPDTPQRRSDPFLQFRVHVAKGLSPFGFQDRSGALDYSLAGGTTEPNRDQYTFEFDLAPTASHSQEWTGRPVQYVRLAATDSRLGKAEQVSQADWEALSPADRGDVEYLWKIGGEERLVTPERYEELPDDERGGVRYYRRERPRVAEVEVWTVGANVGLKLLERGGSLQDINPNSSPTRAFDGNIRTDWFALVYRTVGETAEWGLLTVDLGALFWVDQVRTISRLLKPSGERLLLGYRLRGSDGSRAPDGSLVWQDLSGDERLQNTTTHLFADSFDSQRLRFLEFRNLDIARRSRAYLGDRVQSVVSEIQVFGRGFLPELVLTSDFIDLGGERNLTAITWDADTPPGTWVELLTRTGDELREVVHYYDFNNNEVASRQAYDALPLKGGIVTETLPGADWSNWSQSYVQPGEPIRSPSPRRFMMIQARLLSDDPEATATLRSIEVMTTPPVVSAIVGEVVPKHDVQAGVPIAFSLFLAPTFARGNPGVDRVRLRMPSQAAASVLAVARGTQAQLVAGTARVFEPDGEGVLRSSSGDSVTVTGEGTDELVLSLGRPLQRRGELLKISFQSAIYLSGATFAAQVAHSSDPDNWQGVDAGDAVSDRLGAGEGLTVLTGLDDGIIQLDGAVPPVFSPNGDGVNDEVRFQFAVLRINAEREVGVDVYTLAGRHVVRLEARRSTASGRYSMPWDGRAADGQVVPPGLYLARVQVAGDGGDTYRFLTVGVAY